MKNLIIILIPPLLLSACYSAKIVKIQGSYPPIPESKKKLDIPIYEEPHSLDGHPYVYWNFCKQKQNQLGLESPETTKDSFIFRMWITNPVGRRNQPHGLIELKKDSTNWIGSLTLMRIDFNPRKLTETITESESFELTPKYSDWESIIDSLYKLKINLLPTDEKIPNYYKQGEAYANNEPTYSFEYSNPDEYRFYQYNNIYPKVEKFWQADYVLRIFSLLEEEFQWDSRARAYFKTQ